MTARPSTDGDTSTSPRALARRSWAAKVSLSPRGAACSDPGPVTPGPSPTSCAPLATARDDSWRDECTLAIKVATESKVSAGQITPAEATAILAKHKQLLLLAEREQEQLDARAGPATDPELDHPPPDAASSPPSGAGWRRSRTRSESGDGEGPPPDPRIAVALNLYTDLINEYNETQRVQSAEQRALDEVGSRVDRLTADIRTYEVQLSPLEDAKRRVRGLLEDEGAEEGVFRAASLSVAELTQELGDVLMALRTTEADLECLQHERQSIHSRHEERRGRIRALKADVDCHFRKIEELSMELHKATDPA